MSELNYNKTIDDVAIMFNVNKETVRRWCRDGKIKFIKLPGNSGKGEYRFSKADILDFVAELNTNPYDGGIQDSANSSDALDD